MPTTTTTTTYYPTPPVPIEPTNECDVTTIFPMNAECLVINPTNTEAFNGTVSLLITGGTPPYQILWETGSVGTSITNLGVGIYNATVTDYYGDFTIQTSCELTAPPAPTTTTTTSTTTLPQYGNLCFIISKKPKEINESGGSGTGNSEFIDFNFNGYYNGKPSWLSNDTNDFIYWNTGTTNQWLYSANTNLIIYNPNPATPPISGWEVLGTNKVVVNVTEGSCNSIQPLIVQLSKNDSSCSNDGSIIVSPSGGVPPYTYSLNGGITTQTSPIFQNLAGGTYNVTVTDSTLAFQTQSITVNQTISNTTYVVTLTKSGYNFSISVSPTLPMGISLSYDLVYDTNFKVAPLATSASNTITPNILVDSVAITNPLPVITNGTLFNSCNGGNFYTTDKTYVWQNIVMTTTTTVSGSITNTVTPVLPVPPCYYGGRTFNLHFDNLKINGCDCCSVVQQENGYNVDSVYNSSSPGIGFG